MEQLTVLTWNCHSLYPRLSVFKLELYNLKPHIVCLCETWIKEKYLPNFINYRAFHNFRSNQNGGGTSILVRNDVQVMDKDLHLFSNGKMEVQAVTVMGMKKKLDILNVYNPNSLITINEYIHYFSQLNENALIVGDFNAHHQMWDSRSKENPSGRNLVTSLLDFPHLGLLSTPGANLPTYYHIPNNKYSTLDLCFVNCNMIENSTVELGKDLTSDHDPTVIRLDFPPCAEQIKSRKRWIFGDEAMWTKWRGSLLEPIPAGSFEEDHNLFVDALIVSSEKIFKQTKGVINPNYSKPWWNDECAAAVRNRHRARNFFRRHPTLNNLTELRNCEALVKRVTKVSKRESFTKFCNTIKTDTPTKKVWQQVNALRHKYKPYRNVPIIKDGTIYTVEEDKANIIADSFENIFNTSNVNNEMDITEELEAALTDDSREDYNTDFTMGELLSNVNLLKSTSPGEDKIHNLMLKNLPDEYLNWLLSIYNGSFNSSCHHESWKSATVVALSKEGGRDTDPDAKRPISLLSCIGKLMGRMINDRLLFVLEQNGKLSPDQAGFRRRMCTLDQLTRFESNLRVALGKRNVCMAMFIDFSKAFDCVWHLGLLYKLAKLGIRGKLLRWLREFLTNRTFKVLNNGYYSSVRKIKS